MAVQFSEGLEMGNEYEISTSKKAFKLPASEADSLSLPFGPIIGWEFWEKVNFKDGRSVEARGVTDDAGEDGPQKARCITHDTLYDTAIRAGIPYINKVGECHYLISKDDLAEKFYEWSGPNPIHEPGNGRIGSC
jgi:hypothetical protein